MVVDALQLPRNWQPFELPEVGTTLQERRAHVGAAWQRIRTTGLLDGDHVDIDVAGVFRAWVKPDVCVIVRAQQQDGQHHLLYRVTSTRGTGVFSQLIDDRIRFDEIGRQDPIREITNELPPVPPVPGLQEITVNRGNTSNEVAAEDFDPLARSAPAGTAAADHREMRKFAQWPPVRVCSYELAVDSGNNLNRLGAAQVIDTEGGRYLILPDGDQRIRIVPSDGSHLRDWLHHQVDLAMNP